MSTADQSVKLLSQMKRDVLDIVLVAQRRGAIDMTAAEIQKVYEAQVGHRVRDGYFAGRVSEMVKCGYLLRSGKKRQCKATASTLVNAVYAPAASIRDI